MLQRRVQPRRRFRCPLQIAQSDAMRCELTKELRAGRSRIFSDHNNDQAISLRRFVQRNREKLLRGAPICIDLATGPKVCGELFEKWLRRAHPIFRSKTGWHTDLPERRKQPSAMLRCQRLQPHALALEGAALGGEAPV